MHRPTLTATQAVVLAEDLGHHAVQIAALGDAVPVTAVSGSDVVGVAQVLAHSHCDGFLARVEVNEAGDVTGCILFVQSILERADARHLLVRLQQCIPVQP